MEESNIEGTDMWQPPGKIPDYSADIHHLVGKIKTVAAFLDHYGYGLDDIESVSDSEVWYGASVILWEVAQNIRNMFDNIYKMPEKEERL